MVWSFVSYQEYSFITLKIMKKKETTEIFKIMEKKLYLLHNVSSDDFVLGFLV